MKRFYNPCYITHTHVTILLYLLSFYIISAITWGIARRGRALQMYKKTDTTNLSIKTFYFAIFQLARAKECTRSPLHGLFSNGSDSDALSSCRQFHSIISKLPTTRRLCSSRLWPRSAVIRLLDDKRTQYWSDRTSSRQQGKARNGWWRWADQSRLKTMGERISDQCNYCMRPVWLRFIDSMSLTIYVVNRTSNNEMMWIVTTSICGSRPPRRLCVTCLWRASSSETTTVNTRELHEEAIHIDYFRFFFTLQFRSATFVRVMSHFIHSLFLTRRI